MITDWMADAACLGCKPPDLMFPDEYDTAAVSRAKAVCRRCPVQAECLIDALSEPNRQAWVGVRGGLAMYERLQRRRPHQPMVERG